VAAFAGRITFGKAETADVAPAPGSEKNTANSVWLVVDTPPTELDPLEDTEGGAGTELRFSVASSAVDLAATGRADACAGSDELTALAMGDCPPAFTIAASWFAASLATTGCEAGSVPAAGTALALTPPPSAALLGARWKFAIADCTGADCNDDVSSDDDCCATTTGPAANDPLDQLISSGVGAAIG